MTFSDVTRAEKVSDLAPAWGYPLRSRTTLTKSALATQPVDQSMRLIPLSIPEIQAVHLNQKNLSFLHKWTNRGSLKWLEATENDKSILHFAKVTRFVGGQGLWGPKWGIVGSGLTPGSRPDGRTGTEPDPENPEKPEKPE